MSHTSFKFPYRFRKFDDKSLAYPEVYVELKTFTGKQIFHFTFDSGADMTTMPNYMIKLLEIPESKLTKSRSFGISEEPIPSKEAIVQVRIGTMKFDLPVMFIPNKDVPLLLGKDGIFDRFNILFDNDKHKTVFTVRHVIPDKRSAIRNL